MLDAGIDIVEIERVAAAAARFGDRFLRRVFSDDEVLDCAGRPASLAARFAAKEAAIKALGDRLIALRDVEVTQGGDGKPALRLHGRAAKVAAARGVGRVAVSLSHARHHAVAVVVLQGPAPLSLTPAGDSGQARSQDEDR